MPQPRSELVAAVAFAIVAGRATHAQSTQKVERAWPVMGTMFVATVWGTDSVAMLRGVHAARDSVRLVDSLMSTYRPTSEISRINDGAGGTPQRVSPQTMHVLLHAKRLWMASGGLFDPTVGPLVRAWGFQGDSGAMPSPVRLNSLRALVGYQRVELDSAEGVVRLTRAGVRLDLGGIAKGYALDLARAALTDPRITGGMVDLGGNVLVFGRPPTGTQWVIGIRHPRYADRVLGTVSLDSGAVATSGDYEHFIRVRGVRYGHLIDPFTGYPRRGVMAATAIGPRGEWSDGVSGTLFLTGARRGAQIADSLPAVGGVWVLDRGRDQVRIGDIVSSRRARETFHFTVTGCSDTSSRPARRTSRRPADRWRGSRSLRSDEGDCA